GWALMEECKFRDGAMINNQLTNYLIPTSDDVPPIHVAFLENPYPHGEQGAKALGELPTDEPAPAVLTARAPATGAAASAVPSPPARCAAGVWARSSRSTHRRSSRSPGAAPPSAAPARRGW